MDICTTAPTKTDLYDARRNARLTIEAAADLCGRSVRHLKKQESGDARVDLALSIAYSSPGPDGW